MAGTINPLYAPFDCELNEADILKAERELGETFEARQFALWELKQKLKGETDLVARTDDAYLMRYLRCRKFNVEAALKNIKRYYKIRSKYSFVFEDMNVENLEHIFNHDLIGVSPYRNENRGLLVFVKLGAVSPDVASIIDYFRVAVIAIERYIQEEVNQVNGGILMLDFKGFSFSHLKMLTSPSILTMFFSYVQECLPARLKGIHILNNPVIVGILYKIAKSIMKTKLLKRMHFHGSDMESFHKYVPVEVLSEEYGGTLPPFDNHFLYKKIIEFEPAFKYDVSNFGYNVKNSQDSSSSSNQILKTDMQ